MYYNSGIKVDDIIIITSGSIDCLQNDGELSRTKKHSAKDKDSSKFCSIVLYENQPQVYKTAYLKFRPEKLLKRIKGGAYFLR